MSLTPVQIAKGDIEARSRQQKGCKPRTVCNPRDLERLLPAAHGMPPETERARTAQQPGQLTQAEEARGRPNPAGVRSQRDERSEYPTGGPETVTKKETPSKAQHAHGGPAPAVGLLRKLRRRPAAVR